ncbi:MAG: hypothetical protein ACLR9K_12020, partial [Blautia sp.]
MGALHLFETEKVIYFPERFKKIFIFSDPVDKLGKEAYNPINSNKTYLITGNIEIEKERMI